MIDTPDDIALVESEVVEPRGNPRILDLPVNISVCVGEARLTVRQLMDLTPDALVPLTARIEDPVDLYVGERLVARGELVEAEGDPEGMMVRIVALIGPDGNA